MIKLKFNPIYFLDFLIVLLIILDTHSIYVVTLDNDYNILNTLLLVLLIRIFFGLETYFSAFRGRSALIIWIWLMYSLIFFVVSAIGSVSFIQRFIVLFCLLMIYFDYLLSSYKFKEILRLYIKIIKCIALISLFFWTFGSLLGVITTNQLVTIQWGALRTARSYFGLYYQWQNDAFILGRQFYRNIGIFTEAPMFSLHLSMAYLIEFFVLKEKKVKNLFIYIITTISTYAVTGIILIILSQGMDFLIARVSDSFRKGKFNLLLLLIPIVIIVVSIGVAELFISKLSSASGGSRFEDYIIGYQAWKQNPIWGAGYGNSSVINSLKSIRRFSRSATGYTNSPMYILSEGGLYFFASFMYSFLYYFLRAFALKSYNLFIFASMVLYLFLTTTFQHTALVISLMAFAMISRLKIRSF